MLVIPLKPVPAQRLAVLLAAQSCTMHIYQRSTGLYIDVLVDDALVIGGVLCRNLCVVVRSLYLGFIGDVAFVDTQPDKINGPMDPEYTGLGARYQLIWLAPSELPEAVF